MAQRLHRVPKGKPQFIPWTALYEQFGAGYSQIRDFRLKLLRVLNDVHAQYRAARIDADGQGVTLRNSPPPVAARLAPVRKLLG